MSGMVFPGLDIARLSVPKVWRVELSGAPVLVPAVHVQRVRNTYVLYSPWPKDASHYFPSRTFRTKDAVLAAAKEYLRQRDAAVRLGAVP